MFEIEFSIMRYIQSLRTDFLNVFFELITTMGEETIMIVLVAIIYFAFNKNYAQKLFFVTICSGAVNGIIKNVVKRPRPFTKEGITCVRPETATGYSFPSGHTQNFSTWSNTIALTLKKKWVFFLVWFLIIMIGISRVYLGAHFPTDVIIGSLLGLLVALFASYLYDKYTNKSKLYLLLILVTTPFIIFFLIKPDILFADLYKVYGMMIGMLCATRFEEKYVCLDYNVSDWKKILRIIIAIVLALSLKKITKLIFVTSNIYISLMFSSIRYFILIFMMLGIYPLVIKKCNF